MLKKDKKILGSKAYGIPDQVRKLRFAIVASRYNAELVDTLLQHTIETFSRAGVREVDVYRVPGSYEIPVVVSQLADSKNYQSVLALGVVLQGKTSHADHIALACAIHLQAIAVKTKTPIIHQILTPKNTKDARARVEVRGVEAAQTALEMAGVMFEIKTKR